VKRAVIEGQSISAAVLKIDFLPADGFQTTAPAIAVKEGVLKFEASTDATAGCA
jgi:hypothetical protein